MLDRLTTLTQLWGRPVDKLNESELDQVAGLLGDKVTANVARDMLTSLAAHSALTVGEAVKSFGPLWTKKVADLSVEDLQLLAPLVGVKSFDGAQANTLLQLIKQGDLDDVADYLQHPERIQRFLSATLGPKVPAPLIRCPHCRELIVVQQGEMNGILKCPHCADWIDFDLSLNEDE